MASHSTRLTEYDVVPVPVATTYFDADFNCRGSFPPQSVEDLARSIAASGLLQPICVQPWAEEAGYDYRIVAGHRRFIAVKLFLKWETIPAIIREGLTEDQARLENLKENLDREDLNPLEEAQGIAKAFPGQSINAIAKQLGRGHHWVNSRLAALKLPESIQQQVAAGYFTWQDVKDIAKASDMVAKAHSLLTVRKKDSSRVRRKVANRPTKEEIQEMISFLIRRNMDGVLTRLLGWAAGWVSTEDVHREIDAIYEKRKK